MFFAGYSLSHHTKLRETYFKALTSGTWMNKYIHLKNYLNFMLDKGRDPLCPVVYDIMSYVLHLQNFLKTPGAVFSYLSGAKTWVQSVGGDVSSFLSYQVWVTPLT